MRKLFLLSVAMIGFIASGVANEKMYVDETEIKTDGCAFRIHLGHNVWVKTNTMHKDITGLYTFEDNISLDPISIAHEKEWKCPYCYRYWPIGKPCGNKDCPSRYK